jgi:hypothetical protein
MAAARPRKSATDTNEATAPRVRANNKAQVPFAYKLVLNQWLLSLFNVKRFEDLAEHLRNEALEGLDENNIHRFHHALTSQLFNLTQIQTELLLEYDQNIVKHTLLLNERRARRREPEIAWKYFQYVTLLFTEIYLDRYFRDPEALLASVNAQVVIYNVGTPEADRIAPLDTTADAWPQLNKIAFWMATGSGKTLLMHANILQYQHYLEKHGRRREMNRILLLTPNEGLSQQHLREFEIAGIQAELFSKDGRGLFAGQAVEIIDIHKLNEEMGDKTIAVDAFEGNNLVLVDEGHRGASSGEQGAWMRFRNALCEKGFSFEYSATFGQAVKGSKSLTDLYAKNVLIDYSYRYFYRDGFGKDYQILNLDEGIQENHLDLYLVACLLSFYQQQRLFAERGATFRPFNIEKPLWIFVGGRVTAKLARKDASDIVQILKFLARYVSDRTASTKAIARVLSQGLITATSQNLFAGRFAYLNTCGLTSDQIFDEILKTLFHAPGGGQLYVENLKGATGEVALRLGAENDPFGVINVGDDAELVKLCAENGLATGDLEFSGSLFHEINQPTSSVNILIGSKKFTEGWSSWRVSTMGLMNVGKGEGAQIIQLFGRGVRLKGYDMSLKRSGKTQLPDGIERPKHIQILETLGIFGIHADYMAQFRDFLRDEGLPDDDEQIELVIPVIKNLGTQKLKTIRLKKMINGESTEFGHAFRKLAPVPTLRLPDEKSESENHWLREARVIVNWYPRIQAMKSQGAIGGEAESTTNVTHLTPRHVAFLDQDRIWFELERFKAERGWHNFNVPRSASADLLSDRTWYDLLIPPEEMAFDSFARIRTWEEIAIALLKKYMERFYTFSKREWEEPHLEYQELSENDPNFLRLPETLIIKDGPAEGYRVLIDRSEVEIVEKLTLLKEQIARGELKPWEFRGMKVVWFGRHLYQPLIYLDKKIVEITPVALNEGEKLFVEDLKKFYEENPWAFAGKELYLLRNLSRGRGVGFFEAGNFYPDFIIWLLAKTHQHVMFVDPKGIRNLGPNDDKLRFYRTIKEIETRLGDPAVILDSFIVSNTASPIVLAQWGMNKQEMNARHIVFQGEDSELYVGQIFEDALNGKYKSR